MTIKLLKSISLIIGTFGVLLSGVPGLRSFIVTWAILFAFFVASRFSKKFYFFTGWSSLHFFVTFFCALALPYIWLLLSFGF